MNAIPSRHVLIALGLHWACLSSPGQAENIILVIGDGMGPQQVEAGRLYDVGSDGQLVMQTLPVHASVTTHSFGGAVTDSAAAATAMATGQKVLNDMVSMDFNLDDLKTILESARDAGWSTGLVSTSYITHATPAAFGAHVFDRGQTSLVAADFLNESRPNVLMGGGHDSILDLWDESTGYQLVRTRAEMLGIAPTAEYVLGAFGDGHMPYLYDGLGGLPKLSEIAMTAIANLERDPDGFFLMIESGLIDRAGHINENDPTKTGKMVPEVVEMDRTVEAVLNWAQDRSDTMILVTADHECGDLTVLQDNGIGVLPTVDWGGHAHTGINCDLFAWGPGTEHIDGETIDNTDIYHLMNNFLVDATSSFAITGVEVGETQVSLTWESSPGKLYAIEGVDELGEEWMELQAEIEAAPDPATRTEAVAESFAGPVSRPARRYYRVVEQESP